MRGHDAARGKTAFIAQLRDHHARCGKPAYHKIAALSLDVSMRYPSRTPGGPPCGGAETHLVTLSVSAISEILADKRKGLPSFPWIATFVLCCNQWASEIGTIAADPGRDVLPEWAKRRELAEQARTAGPAARSRGPRGIRLPQHLRDFLADHGPYGRALIQQVADGDAEAIFRTAVLLGTDPVHRDEALALLLQAGASQHAAISELFDASPDGLDPSVAARYARALAEAAKAAGSQQEASAFYKAAARGDAARRSTSQTSAAPGNRSAGIPPQPARHIPRPRPGTDPSSRNTTGSDPSYEQ
jgi:hypothetical protein